MERSIRSTTPKLRLVMVVHGRGRGHAMRAREVIGTLRAGGHHVRVLAGGAALGVLEGEPLLESIDCVAPGARMCSRLGRRVHDDRRRFEADRPDLVITDGDAPSSIAAWSLGIPVIAVGHGLVFAHCDVGPLPIALRVREALNAASASLCAARRIAVHFGPARAFSATTRVARADVRTSLDRRRKVGPHVVAYFRDGGGDGWLLELVRRGVPVVLFSPRPSAPPGIELRPPNLDAFADALSTACGALGTAGSNVVAECAFLGIPLLALPDGGDVEQVLNARILENAGLGVAGRLGTVDPRLAARFVAAIETVRDRGRREDALPHAPGAAACVADAVHELASGAPTIGALRR